ARRTRARRLRPRPPRADRDRARAPWGGRRDRAPAGARGSPRDGARLRVARAARRGRGRRDLGGRRADPLPSGAVVTPDAGEHPAPADPAALFAAALFAKEGGDWARELGSAAARVAADAFV